MSIQGSTVLVTGANRGIGKSFAEALLDRGARKVYAAVRNVSTITDPRVVPIQLDVTDPDRVAAPLITTYSASKAAAWSFTNAARIELRRQGTHVVGVHAGPVDTDMTAAIDLEKIPPTIVAASALDALEADEPEAVVDDYSRAVKAGLSDDQGTLYPQIERQFLEMTGAGATAA